MERLEERVDSLYWKWKNRLEPIFRKFNRLEFLGYENIPEEGALLAANHGGSYFLDGICISVAIPGRQVHTVAHYIDYKWPGISKFLKNVGAYTLDRRPEDIDEKSPVVQALKRGELLSIFPEESYHSIWQRYTLFKFHEKISKYAKFSEAAIVPTAVVGAEEASPCFGGLKLSALPFHISPPIYLPLSVKIILGKPMHYSGQGYEQFANEVRDKVAELIQSYKDVKISNKDYLNKTGIF